MYPDTPDGAIACLKELSILDLDHASAVPDPVVDGVWLVKLANGVKVIVYLAGYKDPFGKIRQIDDFEVED